MAQFEITTESIFSIRHFIEADSIEEAISKIDTECLNGYQKHEGEIVTNVIETTESKDNWVVRQHNENFF